MKKSSKIGERALVLHKRYMGKLAVTSKLPLRNMQDLSLLYTPGVGAVSSYLALHKDKTREYTMKGNCIAVISDGSAVLGLGNLGPEGALPVMEGKCLLFKHFAGIDALPIVLDTQNVDEIVETVKHIAPGFGGINLEDISAPRCFEVEARLKRALDIPVMHDDQHGTAIVILAGLLNALKVVKKKIGEVKIVINGAGAAGTALTHILIEEGVGNLVIADREGAIYKKRPNLSREKQALANLTNPKAEKGELADILKGTDVFIGVSAPGILTEEMVKTMNKNSIIFALANPVPEIMPESALRAGAAVVATGRSDFPNQLNNALVFPGVFRGVLDYRLKEITSEMKHRAAYALASLIKKPTNREIVPSIFDKRIVKAIARAMKN